MISAAPTRSSRTSAPARRRALQVGLLGVALVMIWWRVVPEVRAAARSFDGFSPWFVVAGVALQVTAWITYSVLTRRALTDRSAVSLGRMVRIQITTQAVGNSLPAAQAAGPAVSHRLLARSGVPGGDAAVALGTATFASAAALNAILALSLLVTVPLRGVRGPYLAAALAGTVTIVGLAVVLVAVARQARWTLRLAAWVAERLHRDPLDAELAVVTAGDRISAIAADRRLVGRLATWAIVNWLLDAASLWCFLAAVGIRPGVDALLVAFGVANVLAAVPVSPGGVGVVEWAYLATLGGFGLPGSATAVGVIGYRAAQAILPIGVGAVCALSLSRGPWRLPTSDERSGEAALRIPPRIAPRSADDTDLPPIGEADEVRACAA